MAHYANAAADIEFKFPMGFKELEGIHSRTDFDLKAHEEHSGNGSCGLERAWQSRD